MDILHKPLTHFCLIWPRKRTLLFARYGLITLKTVPHLSSNPYLAENRRHKSYRRRLRPYNSVLSVVCFTVPRREIVHIHHAFVRFKARNICTGFLFRQRAPTISHRGQSWSVCIAFGAGGRKCSGRSGNGICVN